MAGLRPPKSRPRRRGARIRARPPGRLVHTRPVQRFTLDEKHASTESERALGQEPRVQTAQSGRVPRRPQETMRVTYPAGSAQTPALHEVLAHRPDECARQSVPRELRLAVEHGLSFALISRVESIKEPSGRDHGTSFRPESSKPSQPRYLGGSSFRRSFTSKYSDQRPFNEAGFRKSSIFYTLAQTMDAPTKNRHPVLAKATDCPFLPGPHSGAGAYRDSMYRIFPASIPWPPPRVVRLPARHRRISPRPIDRVHHAGKP